MNRAYSVLEEKSFEEDGEFFTIRGIATTPATDKAGDIVEPLGVKFKTPMPLLWQHNHNHPVGYVTLANPAAYGIPFTAVLPIIKEAGILKDRVNEAIHSLKYQLVTAVSIGFTPVAGQSDRIKGGGVRFKEWFWHELSIVTIPSNSQAVITAIKKIDSDQIASAGIISNHFSMPAARSVALTRVLKRGHVNILRK